MATADSTNSFCTTAEADVYFDERLHTSAWTSLDSANEDRDRALIQATRILKSYLTWNDDVDLDAPEQAMKDACCEMALVLLQGDVQVKDDMAGITRLKVEGAVEIEQQGGSKAMIPRHVKALLKAYANVAGGSVEIIRT
jgi:hypothetical protein